MWVAGMHVLSSIGVSGACKRSPLTQMELHTQAEGAWAYVWSSTCTSGGHLCLRARLHSREWMALEQRVLVGRAPFMQMKFACEHSLLTQGELCAWAQMPSSRVSWASHASTSTLFSSTFWSHEWSLCAWLQVPAARASGASHASTSTSFTQTCAQNSIHTSGEHVCPLLTPMELYVCICLPLTSLPLTGLGCQSGKVRNRCLKIQTMISFSWILSLIYK